MKVLKFGGSSVGSAQSLNNVRKIVEATDHPVIVVVSALGGVTDQLITLSRKAASGDMSYGDTVEALVERHHQMVRDVIAAPRQDALLQELDVL